MPRDPDSAPDTRHEHDPAGAPDAPERERREYPHGTGDRNAFAPTRDDPMPRHEGGTQRKAPPGPGAG